MPSEAIDCVNARSHCLMRQKLDTQINIYRRKQKTVKLVHIEVAGDAVLIGITSTLPRMLEAMVVRVTGLRP